MPVQAHKTPNPNALKFVLPEVRFTQPLSFSGPAAAQGDPLAAAIFALDGVYNVFMVQDFVTVNKRPDVPWEPLADQVQSLIERYLAETGM
jgi:hypothetical protein